MTKKLKIQAHKLTEEEQLGTNDSENLIILNLRKNTLIGEISVHTNKLTELNTQLIDVQILLDSI